MFIKLSYDITEQTPYPPTLWPVKIDHVHDMAKGIISNVFNVTLCNHVGTHIDGPMHFSLKKKPLAEFSIEKFIYNNPVIIDIPKNDEELVTAKDLISNEKNIKDCDLLLIRTGFGKIRKDDLHRYTERSSGFDESAARCIVNQFPKVKAVGMDTLTFACSSKVEPGIKAHQIMFDECQRDIFLLEDINLDYDLSALQQVLVVPLFIAGLDSLPCTILASIQE